MRSHLSMRRGLALSVAVVGMLTASTAAAVAQTGGSGAPGSTTTTTTPTTPAPTTPGLATLNYDGSATAPADAPRAVRKAINAANRIRYMPYRWGGGHRKFKDTGYDCSGAVSYVLHAAGLLKTPYASGDLARRWGSPGLGQWITVYAKASHTYVVIAGLRFDTSAGGDAASNGSGPRWRSTAGSTAGYSVKYYPSL